MHRKRPSLSHLAVFTLIDSIITRRRPPFIEHCGRAHTWMSRTVSSCSQPTRCGISRARIWMKIRLPRASPSTVALICHARYPLHQPQRQTGRHRNVHCGAEHREGERKRAPHSAVRIQSHLSDLPQHKVQDRGGGGEHGCLGNSDREGVQRCLNPWLSTHTASR